MRSKTLPLVGIIGLGAFLRIWGITFGLPEYYHPDEMVRRALLTLQRGGSPPDLYYPTVLFYVQDALFVVMYAVQRLFGRVHSVEEWIDTLALNPSPLFVAGRLLSAVLGTALIVITYQLSRRLGASRSQTLLAALFLAVSLPNVQDSHFATSDIALSLLMNVTLLVVLGWSAVPRLRDYVVAGVLIGLAIGTKYSATPLGLVIVVAHFLRRPAPWLRWQRSDSWVLVCGAVSLATFAFTTPFALIRPQELWVAVRLVGYELHAQGWLGSFSDSPLLFHIERSLSPPLGWPFLLGGIVGLLLFWRRDGRSRQSAVVASYLLGYGGAIASSHMVYERYALPLTPILCVLLARGVTGLAQIPRRPAARAAIAGTMAAAFIGTSLAGALWHDWLLTRTDTRQQAAEWLRQHLSSDALVYNLLAFDEGVSWPDPDPCVMRVFARSELRRQQKGPFQDAPNPCYLQTEIVATLDELRAGGVEYVVASSFRVGAYLQVDLRGIRWLPGHTPYRNDVRADAAAAYELYKRLQPFLVQSFTPYRRLIPAHQDLPGKSIYSPSFPRLFERLAPGPTIEIFQITVPKKR